MYSVTTISFSLNSHLPQCLILIDFRPIITSGRRLAICHGLQMTRFEWYEQQSPLVMRQKHWEKANCWRIMTSAAWKDFQKKAEQDFTGKLLFFCYLTRISRNAEVFEKHWWHCTKHKELILIYTYRMYTRVRIA